MEADSQGLMVNGRDIAVTTCSGGASFRLSGPVRRGCLRRFSTHRRSWRCRISGGDPGPGGTALADKSLGYALAPGCYAWVQAIEGPLVVGGVTLQAGDGLAVSDERELAFTAPGGKGDFLLFDLA